jgi:putative hydrolase of the HAD superfamily
MAPSHVLVHRRALLIDAMGTLVRLQDPVTGLVVGLRDRCGLDVAPERAAAGLRAEIAYYRAHMQRGSDASGLAALRRDCAAILRDALGVDADLGAVTAALLDALRFSAFADAPAALARARRAEIRVIVVSNWDISLGGVLERVGLAPLIDGVITSAAVGARKPDPVIFARALALAGARPSECLHVGDSLAEDVAGARAAGIEAVLLDRGRDVVAPAGVRRIAGLDELALPSSPSGDRERGP